jgi:pimeloyl-ACP methyl ester carboxylesterase
MIPTSIIRIWFLGLLSWILLGVGIYLSHKWYHQAWSYDLNLQRSYFDPHFGNNQETRLLIIAASVLFLVLAGGLIVRGILSLLTKANSPKGVGQLPERSRDRVTISQLSRYDATAVLKDINVPALVVAGDRDSVCKPEASNRMHQEIAGATLTHLAPAKHMGLIEHHTRFAEIVRTFSSLCLPTATNCRQHSKP